MNQKRIGKLQIINVIGIRVIKIYLLIIMKENVVWKMVKLL